MSAAEKEKKPGNKTIEDLMNVPDGIRAELIDGEIVYSYPEQEEWAEGDRDSEVMMAPTRHKHSLLLGKIQTIIANYSNERKKSGGSGWVVLPEAWVSYGKPSAFVHDVAAFEVEAYIKAPADGPLLIRPVWVCEILSPSNWLRDTQKKRLVLEEAGVPFYWIVDPAQQSIQVFCLRKKGEHYQVANYVGPESGTVSLPPFDGLEIDLRALFLAAG